LIELLKNKSKREKREKNSEKEILGKVMECERKTKKELHRIKNVIDERD